MSHIHIICVILLLFITHILLLYSVGTSKYKGTPHRYIETKNARRTKSAIVAEMTYYRGYGGKEETENRSRSPNRGQLTAAAGAIVSFSVFTRIIL